jgi:dTDP-4-amino-4,6-dideoxygalactose transaminase
VTDFVRVPFYDHGAEYLLIRSEIDAAISRVLQSGEYEQGDEIATFEREFSSYIGIPHAVTVGSCHDALYRGMLALGIGPGDEVILPANTDIACTVAIHRTGASFIFADIDEKTYNLDPADVVERITNQTRAIMAVHMYGHPADMAALQCIANKHDLLVVEDAALAIGATYQGRRVGTFGDIGCFSHAPSKILGNCGDGGTMTMRDASLADRIRHQFIYWQLRSSSASSSGIKHREGFRIIEEGMHGRMVELSAAILRVKLRHLDRWVMARQQLANTYRERMAGLEVNLPVEVGEITHAYRNFVVRVHHRDAVRSKLAKLGVDTNMHYVPPLHLQPVYAALGYRRGSLPVTERVADELFTLPIYPHLSECQVTHVCNAMAKAIAKAIA